MSQDAFLSGPSAFCPQRRSGLLPAGHSYFPYSKLADQLVAVVACFGGPCQGALECLWHRIDSQANTILVCMLERWNGMSSPTRICLFIVPTLPRREGSQSLALTDPRLQLCIRNPRHRFVLFSSVLPCRITEITSGAWALAKEAKTSPQPYHAAPIELQGEPVRNAERLAVPAPW